MAPAALTPDPFLSGGCHCGTVRYRVGPPTAPATLCHCASCRRATGAHAVGLFTVAAATARISGDRFTEYASSPGVTRGFCAACGTSLTYRHAGWPADLSFTIASLDEPGRVPPADHTGMADAVAWDCPDDGLPQRDGV